MKGNELLTYKVATEAHYEGVLGLWKNHSEWGTISTEQLKSWLATPYEPAFLVVAVNDKEQVMCQCFVTPSRLNTPHGERKAARVSAPIVHSDLKGGNLLDPHHPINEIFMLAFSAGVQQGIEVFYMYPFASWTRVLQISHLHGFPRFSIKTSTTYQAQLDWLNADSGLTARLCSTYLEEHNLIWRTFIAGQQLFAIKHESVWLNYKAADFLKVEVFQDDNLVALLTFNQKKNLVYDVFANTEDLLPTAVVEALKCLAVSGFIKASGVKFLGTPNLLYAFSLLKVSPLEFKQVFAAASFSDEFTFDELENGPWYLTSLE